MNKVKLLSLATVAMLLLNMALLTFLFLSNSKSGGDMPPHIRPEDRPRQIVIERLGLDEQQVIAYDELIFEHRKAVSSAEQKIRGFKTSLYLSLADTNRLSAYQKDSIVTDLGKMQQQIEWTHYRHFEQIRSLCHADQLSAFNELTQELATIFSKHMPPPRKSGQRP